MTQPPRFDWQIVINKLLVGFKQTHNYFCSNLTTEQLIKKEIAYKKCP